MLYSHSLSALLNGAGQPLYYTIAAKYGSNSVVPTRGCCDAACDIIPQPVNTFFYTDSGDN